MFKHRAWQVLGSGMFLLLYFPLWLLIQQSFNQDGLGLSWQGWTFQWYRALWSHQALTQALRHSLWLSTAVASLTTFWAFSLALLSWRYPGPSVQWLQRGVWIAMLVPDLVLALAYLLLFLWVRLPLGFCSLLLADTALALPFSVMIIDHALKQTDPSLVEAARDLGAGEATIVWSIILPLLWPALGASWLLAFSLAMDDVVIATFLGGPNFEVLSCRIYSLVKVGVTPEVNALTTVLCVCHIAILAGWWWRPRIHKQMKERQGRLRSRESL